MMTGGEQQPPTGDLTDWLLLVCGQEGNHRAVLNAVTRQVGGRLAQRGIVHLKTGRRQHPDSSGVHPDSSWSFHFPAGLFRSEVPMTVRVFHINRTR